MLQVRSHINKPNHNAGNFKSRLFLVPSTHFDVEGLPVNVSQLVVGVDYTVEADEAARDTTYSAPSGGERCFLSNKGIYQEYDSNASAWVRISNHIINDTHTFTVTNGFIEVQATQDKSTAEAELPSEDDITGKIIRTRFARPGWTVDNLELEEMLNEHEWVVLRETREGDFIQLGSVTDPCEVKVVEQPLGESPIEYKGMIFEVKYEGNNIKHYTGAVTLKS